MVKTSEDVAVVGAEIPAILKQSINKMKATAITNEDVPVVGREMATKINKTLKEGPEPKFKSNASTLSRKSKRNSLTTKTLKRSSKKKKSLSQIK